VSVDFADDEVSRSLPDSAPLLGDIISTPSISLTLCVFCVIIIYGSVTGILHTITGSSADQVKCSRHARNTWISYVTSLSFQSRLDSCVTQRVVAGVLVY